ncbi:MAG TPA: hypothetical protein RMI62_05460, partial [Polyangiaceae bacterium LLY-WYZ-15_(1-7)]|nr:hypothetical protein [Polyangiaceae bacterium LLY-WYZ-15_(1-7)]
AGRVYVHTALGALHALEPAVAPLPRLVERFQLALGDADGVRVRGDQVVVWRGPLTLRYRLLSEAGELEALGTTPLRGAVRGAVFDGELVWLDVEGEVRGWRAVDWAAGELLALRSDLVRPVFGGERLFDVRDGVLRALPLQAEAAGDALVATALDGVGDVLVEVAGLGATLGGERYAFAAGDGTPLYAREVWSSGGRAFRVSRAALGGTELRLRRRDRSGVVEEVALAVDSLVPLSSLELFPGADDAIAEGARVPLRASFASTDRVARVAGGVDGASSALWLAGASAARWIEAAAPGDLGLSVDGSVSSDTLTVIPNAPGAGAVSIVRPALNGEVLEGEPIDIEVRAPADADGEAHRYTEVLLYDASGGLLERRQVASATARLALRAPAVEVPERLRLEARAHYGPAFHYLDAPAVPLTVQPAVAVPRPVVRGVGPTTLRGATLRVWIADTHGHAARIEVLAEDGAVLASGLTEVDHVIAAPVGAELRVRARLEDGLGNQSVEVVSTRVVAAPTFRLEAEEVPFDVAAP